MFFCTKASFAKVNEFSSINFPTSANKNAQAHFLKGIYLLHSLDYNAAEQEFLAAQEEDPEFAMAYWGEAMTYNYPLWFRQDRDDALYAFKQLDDDPKRRVKKAKTELEKDLIRAANILFGGLKKEKRDIAYSNFMGALHKKYPDNHEIACFYALSLMGTSQKSRHTPSYLRAGEVLKKVLEENPNHPGALIYTIYAYDEPAYAHLALEAAERYAALNPPSSHALHIPSHIFAGFGMWDLVVASNEKSWNFRDEKIQENEFQPHHRAYHSLLWLQYGYLQQGRSEEAKMLLDTLKYDLENHLSDRAKVHYNMMRATYLVNTQDWEAPVANINLNYSAINPVFQALDHFTDGLVAVKTGRLEDAEKILKRLKTRRKKSDSRIIDAVKNIGPKRIDYSKKEEESIVMWILENELKAAIWIEKKQYSLAESLIKEAVELQNQLPFRFEPPFIAKPALELYGDLLLIMGRANEALIAYEKVFERHPRRTLAIQGVLAAAKAIDNRDKMEEASRALNALTLIE